MQCIIYMLILYRFQTRARGTSYVYGHTIATTSPTNLATIATQKAATKED